MWTRRNLVALSYLLSPLIAVLAFTEGFLDWRDNKLDLLEKEKKMKQKQTECNFNFHIEQLQREKFPTLYYECGCCISCVQSSGHRKGCPKERCIIND